MALTRKFLSALGIDADKIDEIITAHTDTIEAIKAERDQYKADAAKLPTVQKDLDDLKNAAKDGGDPYEQQYKALKKQFDDYKADVTAKEAKAAKTQEYRAILREAGISDKRLDAVLKVSDIDALKLDKDGKIEGKDALIQGIKNEWADFIETPGAKGANTPNPPSGGGGAKKTKEEIYSIKDPAERQKAIAENHELFGF